MDQDNLVGGPLVSVVIPTRNSEKLIASVLTSISHQTYKNIEVDVIDNYSQDRTREIASELGARIYVGGPRPPRNDYFTAPLMRQLGFSKIRGKYVYFVDSDMVLAEGLIQECVNICQNGSGAVIVPEVSIGTGFWTRCKIAERNSYPGNEVIEAPRFIESSTLRTIGGWQYQAGGMDDWYTHFALRVHGCQIEYCRNFVFHDEGELTLERLFRKKFNIGKSTNIGAYSRQLRFGPGMFTQLTPLRYAMLASKMLERKCGLEEIFGAIFMKSIEAVAFYLGSLAFRKQSGLDSELS